MGASKVPPPCTREDQTYFVQGYPNVITVPYLQARKPKAEWLDD